MDRAYVCMKLSEYPPGGLIFCLFPAFVAYILTASSDSPCYSYQLDQSALRVVGGIFHFYSNFNRTFCKQVVETLIRHRVLLCLIYRCFMFLCPRFIEYTPRHVDYLRCWIVWDRLRKWDTRNNQILAIIMIRHVAYTSGITDYRKKSSICDFAGVVHSAVACMRDWLLRMLSVNQAFCESLYLY